MIPSIEQLATALGQQSQTQLALATSLAGTLFASTGQIAKLNLQATRTGIDAMFRPWYRMMSAPGQAPVMASDKPQGDFGLGYLMQLGGIASAAQREAAEAAEIQLNRASRQLVALLDQLGRHAPAGSDTALALMKAAIDNTSSGFSQLNKSTRVAIDALSPAAAAATAMRPALRPASRMSR